MYGRILVKDGSAQMVEAPNQSCTSEGLRDDLGRRLSSQFLRGHAVGIGHIDDDLSLPGRQRPRDIPTMSALTASASFLGTIVGPIEAAADAKLSGSRVVATDTSMPLRPNALARAWPILPKPIIALLMMILRSCVQIEVEKRGSMTGGAGKPVTEPPRGQTRPMPPSTARSPPVM